MDTLQLLVMGFATMKQILLSASMMVVIVVEIMSIQFIVLNVNATIKKFVKLESLILMLEMAIATMKQTLLPVCMMVWSAVDLPSIQNIVLIANVMVYTSAS